jgi:hypothetical protein
MAAAVAFASDDASFITATAFVVDGGITNAYVTPCDPALTEWSCERERAVGAAPDGGDHRLPARPTLERARGLARIVQTIRVGVVAPGEALPPERALAELYGVSRDTVRTAIKELSDAGFLVAPRPVRRHLRRRPAAAAGAHPARHGGCRRHLRHAALEAGAARRRRRAP